MGNYIKQNDVSAEAKRKRGAKGKTNSNGEALKVEVTGVDDPIRRYTSIQHDINYVGGLDGIEQSLDWIARGLEKLTSDECSVTVSATTNFNSEPIKITLAPNDYDDMMDRFVAAVERIADSMARLAGLNRPRLERWYEQDEYTPRHKLDMGNSGATGPETAA